MNTWERIRDDAELEHARKSLSFREFCKIIRHAQADYKAAIEALLESPYGCAFCDYGRLRNPNKAHSDNCAHALVEGLLKRDARRFAINDAVNARRVPGPPDGPGIPPQPFG
jgi:hypothetical protein